MSRPTHIELAGRQRVVLPGCLRYATPPPPGTVLGPIYTGELVVVLDTIDGNTYLSYAQADDVAKSENQEG